MLSKPATPAVTSTLATKETLEEVLVAGIGIETCVHMVVKRGSCLSDSKSPTALTFDEMFEL